MKRYTPRQVADLIDDLKASLEKGVKRELELSEAEVFKGFRDSDAKQEGETHSRIDAKVRARRGEG